LCSGSSTKQRGAVEACWAHNPEVGGSKSLAANLLTLHSLYSGSSTKQRGAVEACWAHNSEFAINTQFIVFWVFYEAAWRSGSLLTLHSLYSGSSTKQRGAVEACWAHNPEFG
uniref:SCP domain-containing protein n=1 Tax=Angiostrongylus cantonensis TaxID=6313 RepID=A0A0K0D806_ANGCA